MRTFTTGTTKRAKVQESANGPSINASESPTCEKDADDRIDKLVGKQFGNIQEAEKAFTSALALLEKQKTKHPALEQYIQQVSPSNRSTQILQDIKDTTLSTIYLKSFLPARSWYIKSLIQGKRRIPRWSGQPECPSSRWLWQKPSLNSLSRRKLRARHRGLLLEANCYRPSRVELPTWVASEPMAGEVVRQN